MSADYMFQIVWAWAYI